MESSEIILIHLSDIHFYDFNTANGQVDLNEDLRNELERDAERLAQEIGHVDGILVTGDIAFGGKFEQYAVATQWLDGLRRLIGSPAQNIWTIPGNHDIYRPVIKDSLHIPDMHGRLRSVDIRDIDSQLLAYLGHSDGDLLFTPIANYNTFAAPYGCTSTRLRPYWEHDLHLNDGSYLRLLGLNSVIISDESDDQKANKLILGEKQSKPHNFDGVTYLALCHHPFDWLRDQDPASDNLMSRTAIQLFGHKHTLRHRKVTNATSESLVIAAGAVHPSRKEDDWKPRYNFMSVCVAGHANRRNLEVKVWPRIYNEYNKFVADRHPDTGSSDFIYQINLNSWNGKKPPVTRSTHEQLINPTSEQGISLDNGMLTMNKDTAMENERILVYRFFSLSYPQSIRIAIALDLLKDEDRGAGETELLNRFYARAKLAGKLADLWNLVEQNYSDGQILRNPFV